ncbi:hypothetical protein [Streptomyces sp. NPDC014734]|uniref:hypothetical protein n=1 Tax=Streptomyces sp. NPDC014734 TaxID=3364886 RepID=UPI0037028577
MNYDETFEEMLLPALYQRAGRINRESARTMKVLLHVGGGKTEAYSSLLSYFEAQSRADESRERMRSATTVDELRSAAREYLEALAELFACLLRFIVAALLLALFRSTTRLPESDHSDWKSDPIDISPGIAPRGPNTAVPVLINRGGHHRSTLGSVVLAA